VIGYIAATAGPNDWHIIRRQHIRFLAAAAQSVNVGMLDEEEDIRRALTLFERHELFLQLESREIIEPADVSV
jgi:hypothetical protein